MFILIQQAKAKASVSVDAIILSAVDSKVGFKVEEILYVTIFCFVKSREDLRILYILDLPF